MTEISTNRWISIKQTSDWDINKQLKKIKTNSWLRKLTQESKQTAYLENLPQKSNQTAEKNHYWVKNVSKEINKRVIY